MYWYDHILPRFIVGLGTSALTFPFLDWRIRDKFELSTSPFEIVTVGTRKSTFMLFQTWFSLYTGWGCYFGFGGVANPCGRVAFADWILGRQDVPGWSWSRRAILNWAGLGWRGLQVWVIHSLLLIIIFYLIVRLKVKI